MNYGMMVGIFINEMIVSGENGRRINGVKKEN